MTRTPEEVFAHHAQALGAGDLEGIVAAAQVQDRHRVDQVVPIPRVGRSLILDDRDAGAVPNDS